MSSIEPYVSSHEEHGGEEISGCFIVTGGNGSELLEFCEEIFDEMARFIQVFVIGARIFSVGFWWDDDLYPGLFQRVYDSFIGVKSFIGKQPLPLCSAAKHPSLQDRKPVPASE